MKIERAVREKTYTLTSIAGPSGSGKTYSALLYARGLVGPEGKIGFIDTENKRSRFYADVAGGFDVIDLDPPFTSTRYVEAIKAFEKAGYPAIVIDSISHEWEGSGGVLEQAEAIEERTKRAGLHCWQKPKASHKKLMNELLQTRAHLIFCCRVKEKVVQAKGRDGKTEIINEGFVVVQEKSFIYEMTVSMMLEEGTHVPTMQKCPGDLMEAFPQGSRITTQIGASVRQWSNEGRAVDTALEDAKREGLLIAAKGVAPLTEWWKSLGKDRRAVLEDFKDTLKSIATAHDQMLSDQMDAGNGAEDIGSRIAQARKAAGEPTGEQEGFNRDFVRQQTRSAPNGPSEDNQNTDTADQSPSGHVSVDDESSPDSSQQDGGEASSPSASSPSSSSIPEEYRDHFIDFARKALKTASDADLDKDARKEAIEGYVLSYREVIPESLWQKLSGVKIPVLYVVSGDRSVEQARNYIARDLLECPVSEIGG